jgi:hypothetical protein
MQGKPCQWECKLVELLWKAVWGVPKKLKTGLPYDPVILLLGIYPKEHKSGYSRDLEPDVYHSTVHNSQALETSLVPYN